MDFAARDRLVSTFRRQVAAANGLTPLRAQAEWQYATEGYTLESRPPAIGDFYADVLLPTAECQPGSLIVSQRLIREIPCAVVRQALTPRVGGAAHICAALEAFKAGKSFWSALWASGFAVLPGAAVDFIGLEYSTSEPEFNYLIEMLCSAHGMGMKYRTLHNDANHGRMKLVLSNGMTYQCKSWERKEGLKGKKRVAYIYTESYQLPGLEVYTSLSQNLREQRGYALFPTTPDRPWVGIFHDFGHGQDPDWHCTCCVDSKENPYTFDQKARDRDDPDKGGIMTREKFAIAWRGQLGRFIGRVYEFSRGDAGRYFSWESHPYLWKRYEQEPIRADG